MKRFSSPLSGYRFRCEILGVSVSFHHSSLAVSHLASVENLGCGGNDLRWGFYAVE